MRKQHGSSNANNSAWPIANPVLTCASPSRAGHPSNFVADPFLYVQVRCSIFFVIHSLLCGENISENLVPVVMLDHISIRKNLFSCTYNYSTLYFKITGSKELFL